jgi:hypothetical protein
MQRERKALCPWVDKYPWRLADHMGFCGDHRICCHDRSRDAHGLLNYFLENSTARNPLFDLLLKAIIRAEVRLVSRFIPQRSHEERLTGNLVSEIDAAIYLVRESFRQLALERYQEPKEIDFYYYDLSRGGRVEKVTGADLGLMFVIDLPDYPMTVRSIRLQAKKLEGGSAQIDLAQFGTLGCNGNDTAYLFYDMDYRTLMSPIVVECRHMSRKAEKAGSEGHGSFTMNFEDVSEGIPLSLYVPFRLFSGEYGMLHRTVSEAYSQFRALSSRGGNQDNQSARYLGIVSLGKPISLEMNGDGGLGMAIGDDKVQF